MNLVDLREVPYSAPTPLCPAGHLPLKGGDRPQDARSPITNIAGDAARPKLVISPLEGEMSGRTEGGRRRPFHKTEPTR